MAITDLKNHKGPVRIAYKSGDRSYLECTFDVHSIHGDVAILVFIADGPGWMASDRPLVVRMNEMIFHDASYYLSDWREANAEQTKRHRERIKARAQEDAERTQAYADAKATDPTQPAA